ncbi:T9SS type A sorting domain-containing protein [candidate division WOR-3 bacterium]|nr:T9SS type A sorting domain-containing protein [candidate division WOR-3 bacterium]
MRYSVIALCLFSVSLFANKAEVVSEDVIPRWMSLDADTTGRPHLAYYAIDEASSPYSWRITYATKNGSWQKLVVDSSKAVSHDPAGPPDVSLALDENDVPAMTYWRDITDDSLCYAHKEGSAWQVDAILDIYPSWPTLRFGGAVPFIVYSRYIADSSWVFIGSAGQSPTGWVWDSTGVKERLNLSDRILDFVWTGSNAEILYIYSSGTGYKRLVRPLSWDGDWTYAPSIDSTGSDPRESGVHMALSRSGIVGACFAHQDNGGSGGPYGLYYVTHSGSGQLEIVDTMLMKTGSANSLYCGPAIAYDTLNRPHIVYVSEGASGAWILTHAWKQGSGWQMETLDTLSNSNLFRAEVSIDRLNRLHVAYIASSGSDNSLYYLAPGGSGVIEEKSETREPALEAAYILSSGDVRFNIPGIDNALVDVYNSTGRLVETLTITDDSGTWHAEGSPQGVYYARVRGASPVAAKVVLLK